MSSLPAETHPRPPIAAPARTHKDVQYDCEPQPEEEHPVMQYLINKNEQQPFDHCLWFSRGMHHVRLPGYELRTAVQSAERDRYLVVLGHGPKRKLRHRVKHALIRAAPRVASALAPPHHAHDGARASATVPHAHLCIVTKARRACTRFDTMSLAEALQWCDRNQLAAYVESCSERDLPLYKARGFNVVQTVRDVDERCPQLNSLWRPPRVSS